MLPRPMIKFAEPTVEDLTDALSDAIPLARKVVPSDFHAKASRHHLPIACLALPQPRPSLFSFLVGYFFSRGGDRGSEAVF